MMDKNQWKERVIEDHREIRDVGKERRVEIVRERAAKLVPQYKKHIPQGMLEEASKSAEGLYRMLKHLRLSEFARPYVMHSRVDVQGATRHAGQGFSSAYWGYTFKVATTLTPYQDQPRYEGMDGGKDFITQQGLTVFCIERRFTHFEWLRKCLLLEQPGCFVPPLPEKTMQSLKDKAKGKAGETYKMCDLEDTSKRKGVWQPDSAASVCNACRREFTFMRRRHHCRHCSQIFCDDCCPKGPGGTRKCKECVSLKGISQFLADHPDVAFRMRYLTQFLATCFAGPLSESESLRFFVEAPTLLLEQQMEKKLNLLQLAHDATCDRGILDKVNFSSWEKECLGKRPMTLTPRSTERRDLCVTLLSVATEYEKAKKNFQKELAEALERKIESTPKVPDVLQDDQVLQSLNAACGWMSEAVADCPTVNKELMFNLSVDMSYLADLQKSAVESIGRIEHYNSAKKKTKSPTVMAKLEDLIAQATTTSLADLRWLKSFHRISMRKVLHNLVKYEAQRDPHLFDWTSLGPHIAKIPDSDLFERE